MGEANKDSSSDGHRCRPRVSVVFKAAHHLDRRVYAPFVPHDDLLYKQSALGIVALALAYSTAIELAYTLFTDQLDEAVQPLIVGVAAAIVLVVSSITDDIVPSSGGLSEGIDGI